MAIAVPFADGFNNRARVDCFVDVEGNGGHLERRVLFLPSPDKLRVKMRVIAQFFARLYVRDGLDVIVNFVSWQRWVGLGRDEANWRIVDTFLVRMLVAVNRALLCVRISAVGALPSRHWSLSGLKNTGSERTNLSSNEYATQQQR